MKALLVIKTANGFAVAPYSSTVPENFVADMSVASKLTSYSYTSDTVAKILEDYFEPAEVVQLKAAA